MKADAAGMDRQRSRRAPARRAGHGLPEVIDHPDRAHTRLIRGAGDAAGMLTHARAVAPRVGGRADADPQSPLHRAAILLLVAADLTHVARAFNLLYAAGSVAPQGPGEPQCHVDGRS